MKDISSEIEYQGKKYMITFDINVMEEIQETYGSMSAWSEKIEPTDGSEPNIKALKFGFTAMLNEGIDITNEKNGKNEVHLTSSQVGRIISGIGIEETGKKLSEVIVNSTKSAEKNA